MTKLHDFLPDGVDDVFRLIAVAEEELGDYRARGSLRVLYPSPLLRDKGEALYRANCRELIARHKAGKPLEPATDAELLAVYSEASLKAPLNAEAQACMEALFARCFPDKVEKVLGQPAREKWDGQVAKQIAALRKRTSFSRGET